MAIRLEEFDMVIPGCVHSHGNLTKRTQDDCDAQSLEAARQVGTGLFNIRIDHLIHNDYARNPLLNDFVIDFDDEPGIDSTARDSD